MAQADLRGSTRSPEVYLLNPACDRACPKCSVRCAVMVGICGDLVAQVEGRKPLTGPVEKVWGRLAAVERALEDARPMAAILSGIFALPGRSVH